VSPENAIYFDLISAVHIIPHFINVLILGILGFAAVS